MLKIHCVVGAHLTAPVSDIFAMLLYIGGSKLLLASSSDPQTLDVVKKLTISAGQLLPPLET